MSFENLLIITLLSLLIAIDIDDTSNMASPLVESTDILNGKEVMLPICDDTTAFKSQADLEPLAYLQDRFLCHATKEVPGLGSIPWTANTRSNIYDGKLTIDFHTALPYFDFMLLREVLVCTKIPMELGVYPLFCNINACGGYARFGSDGDVGDGAWVTDGLCTNYIEIKQIDLECREVRGNFEMHLIMIEPGQFGVDYSERINFLNGKFETRIHNF
jgi:hypothetical protein